MSSQISCMGAPPPIIEEMGNSGPQRAPIRHLGYSSTGEYRLIFWGVFRETANLRYLVDLTGLR